MSTEPNGSTVAWGAAGVPLLVALVQTLLALFGYSTSSAGLEPVADPILSVPVLFQAAVVFKDSSALVMALFLLIVAAWAAQGVAMLLFDHREAAYGTATLSAVLFFALFFGVYAPLLSRDVPALQLAGFFAVPVVAAALQLYAVRSYRWNDVVLEETSGELGRLKTELDDLRSTFEAGYESRFDGLDDLETVAPEGTKAVREGAASFRDRLDDVEADIAECQRLTDGEEARTRRAAIEERLESLSAERRLDELDEEFARRLTSGLRTEFGKTTVRSRYGDEYSLVNLPTRFREVSLPNRDGGVHIDHVADELVALADESDTYAEVAAAVDAVDQHRSDLRTYVDEHESAVADAVERAEQQASTAESQVDSLDVPFADRVADVFVDGRDADAGGVRSVRTGVEEAKEALHDCRFEEAEDRAEEAATLAARLVSAVEFVGSLRASIDNRHESVSVPSGVADEYVETLLPAIQAGYDDVSVTYDDAARALRFDYPAASASTPTRSTDSDAGSGDAADDADSARSTDSSSSSSSSASASPSTSSTPGSSPSSRERVPPPEEVVDEVLYALRDFQRDVDDDGDVVQYNVEALPESVATRPVLVNLERFASRQSDLFDAVDLQSPEPPGFIEFTTADGVSASRALERTHQRFREKYT
ncbi:hypothetical protein [Halobaculum sp. D14]|uniref:hypothetical protein n=1 Tax=Halobaculum sp. D14 TaxID=3421642 RepID=UPI003EB75EBA